MVDKPTGPGKEDEYHFTEPESMDVYRGPGGKPGSSRPPQRNFMVIIFVVVIAFSVYQLLNHFFGKRKIVQKKPPVIRVVEEPKVKEILPMREVDIGKEDRIKPFADLARKNQQNIMTLNTGIRQISQKLSNITSSLDKTSKLINGLGKAIVKQQADLRELRKLKLAKKPIAREIYYVKAIVPGRAWLGNESGKTTTISEGDRVPGYGIIELIDPKHGFIVTSSGEVMRYHPNDS